jgi:hypothetical protein
MLTCPFASRPHRGSFYFPAVSKNVSKGVGKVLGRVVVVLSLTQSQNWAFLGLQTSLRRPIPIIASKGIPPGVRALIKPS